MLFGQVQSLVAKRVRTRVRRRRVSHIRGSGEHRAFGAPMNGNCTLWTLRVAWLKAFSLLRFFVALDKEMTRRHAQWLKVIKRKSDSCRPLTPKAPTRHGLRPLNQEPGTPASTLTANPKTWHPNTGHPLTPKTNYPGTQPDPRTTSNQNPQKPKTECERKPYG